MTPPDVMKDIQAHLVPGAVIVPAMVGEVTRLMQLGYTLVFVPTFRP
jgi:intracellular sulfur oxidation DsrE/DsrF family protein